MLSRPSSVRSILVHPVRKHILQWMGLLLLPILYLFSGLFFSALSVPLPLSTQIHYQPNVQLNEQSRTRARLAPSHSQAFARAGQSDLSARPQQEPVPQIDQEYSFLPLIEVLHAPLVPVVINEILASNGHINIDPDFHALSDWVELHNTSRDPVDLSGHYLTDNQKIPTKWQIPANTVLPPAGFLLIWADSQDSGYHTNFSLSASGEEVALFSPDGLLISQLKFAKQQTDISYGKSNPLTNSIRYFAEPTPGAQNRGFSSSSLAATNVPSASIISGFYTDPLLVKLSAEPQATIRYTLDGKIPTSASPVYSAPIAIDVTTVLKVRAFQNGKLPSPLRTSTYFVDEPNTLPTISLSTDPLHFWDNRHGIYVEENIALRKDWERPAHIEYFDTSGDLGFAAEVNIRLFGNSAFILPQKSLSIIAKTKLGTDRIEYPLFANNPVRSFKSFILRSSSDDWNSTLFRDGMLQSVLSGEIDLDLQAYQPAALFVNGEYYGIHNIREKLTEHYIADHHNLNKDQVDLVKQNLRLDTLEATAGDLDALNELLQFVTERKPFSSQDYTEIETMVDVQNYMDYVISIAYFANTSWGHNRRLWRPRVEEGGWRAMIFDLDRAFREEDHDTLGFFIAQDIIFSGLWSYPPFREAFQVRLDQLSETTFAAERIQTIISQTEATVAPEIERHIERWRDICWSTVCGIPSTDFWEREIAGLTEFASAREANFRADLNAHLSRAAAAQSLPATINSDLLLTKANSPYVVKNDLFIAQGATLTAEPGTQLFIDDGKNIFVSGSIQLNGSAADPVQILSLKADKPWGAIIIEDATAPSAINHVIVRNGSHGPDRETYRAAITSIRSDITIDGLDIAEIQGSAIYMDSSNLVLRNCLVDMPLGQSGNLIDIEYGDTLIERCRIIGHDTCCSNAIDLDYVESATVRNNSILDFSGRDSDGVDVGTGSKNVMIEQNVISNCGDKGISIGERSNVVAQYNTIVMCLMGIAVKDDSNATIDHNVLHGNGIGINVYNLLEGYGGGNASVSNTIISNSITAPVQADSQSLLDVKYSLSNTEMITGSTNLWADPRFLNPSGMNFLIGDGSPAIDAGDPTSTPDSNGSVTDIGVFPYMPIALYLPINFQ